MIVATEAGSIHISSASRRRMLCLLQHLLHGQTLRDFHMTLESSAAKMQWIGVTNTRMLASKSYALSCTNERDEGLANVGGSPATLSNGPRSNNSCFLLRQEARTRACGQTKRGDVTRQTAQFSKITKGCGHSNPRSRVPPPRLTSPARIICMLTVSAAASHAPTDSRRLRRNPCLFNALRTVSCAPIPQLRGALSRPLQASA